VDFSEDIGQILLTSLFDFSYGTATTWSFWSYLVTMSSLINQTKWALVKIGSLTIASIFVVTTIKVLVDKIFFQWKKLKKN
jgi:hypothetical protein